MDKKNLHFARDHAQPKQLSEFPEFCFCKRLGKDVGNVVSGRNVSDRDFSIFNCFANEVVAHVNIFSESDRPLIIAI